MEVYIHTFFTQALKASVVSSTPQPGPRARMDSVETRKMTVPAGNRVRIPCGVVTTVTELPQSVTEIGRTAVLLCIREPQYSYLGTKTGYPNIFRDLPQSTQESPGPMHQDRSTALPTVSLTIQYSLNIYQSTQQNVRLE